MAKVKNSSAPTAKRGRPALSPEARENQLISLAVDLAKQQLLENITATLYKN